jgi:hypothetical protein
MAVEEMASPPIAAATAALVGRPSMPHTCEAEREGGGGGGGMGCTRAWMGLSGPPSPLARGVPAARPSRLRTPMGYEPLPPRPKPPRPKPSPRRPAASACPSASAASPLAAALAPTAPGGGLVWGLSRVAEAYARVRADPPCHNLLTRMQTHARAPDSPCRCCWAPPPAGPAPSGPLCPAWPRPGLATAASHAFPTQTGAKHVLGRAARTQGGVRVCVHASHRSRAHARTRRHRAHLAAVPGRRRRPLAAASRSRPRHLLALLLVLLLLLLGGRRGEWVGTAMAQQARPLARSAHERGDTRLAAPACCC